MPTDIFNEILNGNTAVTAAAIVIMWRQVNQILKRLDTNNDKLDEVAKVIIEMDKNVQKHTVELEFGTKEMVRQDEHNKSQDIMIGKNRDDINKLKGKYIT